MKEGEKDGKTPQKAIKKVIVMVRQSQMECWGSLTEICKIHGFPYHTLKKMEFPFEHAGWIINKIPFRERSNIVKPLNPKSDANTGGK